jgi:hypothetical protein
MSTDLNDDEILAQVIEKLSAKFPEVSRQELEGVVRTEFDTIAGAPVRDYLGVLTERAAKKRLRAKIAA